jgi:hypothetical protein
LSVRLVASGEFEGVEARLQDAERCVQGMPGGRSSLRLRTTTSDVPERRG